MAEPCEQNRMAKQYLRWLLARIVLLLCLACVPATTATAAELIMVETRGCAWCIIWHREIGPAYPRTAEGRRAPLRTVDLSRLDELQLELTGGRVTATPTFILVEDRREVGRIVGYPGAEFFWHLLGEQLAKLPAPIEPSTRASCCDAIAPFASQNDAYSGRPGRWIRSIGAQRWSKSHIPSGQPT